MSKTLFNKLPDEIARKIYEYIYCDVMKELTKTIEFVKIEPVYDESDSDLSDIIDDYAGERYEFTWKNIYENCIIYHNYSTNIIKDDIDDICIRQCKSCSFQSDNEYNFSVWGYCHKNCYRPKY
jgi:hypothetical protein